MKKEVFFSARVRAVVKKIPKGNVLAYADVARRSGSAKASGAVGSILNKNFNPTIPCHRAVRLDGSVGGYNRGRGEKIKKFRAIGALV